MKLSETLQTMGYESDWVADDQKILLWERAELQPTEAELVAAGWVKPESEEETPTE